MIDIFPTCPTHTQIDEARRRLHARLHSAGHALDVAMARIGLGGECLKPTKGYHFADGPYVEYEGEYAADTGALAAALNAEMARLVEEGTDTKVMTECRKDTYYICMNYPHVCKCPSCIRIYPSISVTISLSRSSCSPRPRRGSCCPVVPRNLPTCPTTEVRLVLF